MVFPGGAPWTHTYTAGGRNMWAPDISCRNGRYYLYYSASTFDSNPSAIFLATISTGTWGWGWSPLARELLTGAPCCGVLRLPVGDVRVVRAVS